MLKRLWIKNFILIDELSIEFKSGLTVFSGETGAGKSIIIDAISALIGNRVNTSLIKQNTDSSIIEGEFEINNTETLLRFKEAGFNDDVWVLTREINRDGKNSIRLNRRLVPLNLVRELFQDLIDIHDQSENQYLMQSKNHLKLLDNFFNNKKILEDYQLAYEEYRKALLKLKKLEDDDFNSDEIEFIRFQLQEIEMINPLVNEDDDLLKEITRIQNYEKESKSIKTIIENLDPALNYLYQAKKEIEGSAESFGSLKENLENNYFEIEELIHEFKNILTKTVYDEEGYNLKQERIFELNKLKRKYGSLEDALFKKNEFIEKINNYENRVEVLEKQTNILEENKEIALNNAKILSEARQKNALILEKYIKNSLLELQLNDAIFKIKFEPMELDNTGIDNVEFYISTNKGQPLQPLIKVASGGEISRIMLALKSIFTEIQALETVIFDEIDIGVSGKVANLVGIKMKNISKTSQVIAITHLPNVAAKADHLIIVEKETTSNHVNTKVRELKKSEFVHQIALMASGTITENSLKAAKELLNHE